ncbi:MAG: gas vesicle protein [archaeon]
MEPTRERNATLVDLLDRVLDKGLIINADIIISLAGIPLIGVNLKAAIAGIETMLEYGMMQEWDETIRAISRKEIKEKLPLLGGEKIFGKMFASYFYAEGDTWRAGWLYSTNKRIFLFRDEILFETALEKIKGLVIAEDIVDKRKEIYLEIENQVVKFHAKNIFLLKDFIKDQIEKFGIILKKCDVRFLIEGQEIIHSDKMWYMTPANKTFDKTWQPGQLYLATKDLYWYNSFDEKIMLTIPINKIMGVKIEKEKPYNANNKVLAVSYAGSNKETTFFSNSDEILEKWENLIKKAMPIAA